MRVGDTLKKNGYRLGGMLSSEARIGGSRARFEIIELLTGQRRTVMSQSVCAPFLKRQIIVTVVTATRIQNTSIFMDPITGEPHYRTSSTLATRSVFKS